MSLDFDSTLLQNLARTALGDSEVVREILHDHEGEIEAFSDLTRRGLLSEEDCYRAWAESLGLKYCDLDNRPIDRAMIHRLPLDLARRYGAIAIREDEDTLLVALRNPLDIMAVDAIQEVAGIGVEVAVSSPTSIERALDSIARRQTGIEGLLARVRNSETDVDLLADPQRLKAVVGDDAVIQVVDYLLEEAMRAEASDVHLEPMRHSLRIRLRIDGRLEILHRFPVGLRAAVCSRIKVMAGMDIGESRKPQDGRFVLESGIEVRASCLPTTFGEKVVLRILDRRAGSLDLAHLGMSDENVAFFRGGFTRSHGMVLLTGPTGSGKTTTLYSALRELNKETVNIISVEDPVEYEITGSTQVQVDEKAGRTFASTLRSMLRQDPDVIMVGEIRDAETAAIAVQAALTGHLVLSTLHTNDAPSAVHRLLDMGVPAYLVGPALRCVVGQRLVPRLCQECCEPVTLDPETIEAMNLQGHDLTGLRRGVGCDACRGNGFRGRISIHEVMSVNEEMGRVIARGGSDLETEARQNGYRTMLLDGIDKARAGLVAIEEILSVARTE